jgi:ankyrin repeat protein
MIQEWYLPGTALSVVMNIFDMIKAEDQEVGVAKLLDSKPSLLQTEKELKWYARSYHGHSDGIQKCPPLTWAASKRNLGLVQLLLDKGANAHAPGSLGVTALHFAAQEGHEDMVELLMRKGALITKKGLCGMTPLMLASTNGHPGVVKMMLPAMDRLELAQKDLQGWTTLHHAAYGGRIEVVDLLLSKGAQVQSKDATGRTPLMLAADKGHLAALSVLIKAMHGQGLDENDAQGWTALHHAVSMAYRSLKVVHRLLDKGARPDAKDHRGVSVLMLVAKGGYSGPIRALLKHLPRAALLNERDEDGRTALHYVAEHYSYKGHVRVMLELLEAGADATVLDNEGRDVRALAKERQRKYLLRHFEVRPHDHYTWRATRAEQWGSDWCTTRRWYKYICRDYCTVSTDNMTCERGLTHFSCAFGCVFAS